MQSSLLGTCVLETDRPDTAGCDQVPTCLASGENTWKSLLPRAGRCRPCSVNSCDAGAHPASSAEYGSQMPPCDPNLTRPKRLGDHHCSSVRRANGLVQTRQCLLVLLWDDSTWLCSRLLGQLASCSSLKTAFAVTCRLSSVSHSNLLRR